MHYTSIENIHKVIDPLFLEDFEKKFFNIRQISDPSKRLRELHDFQQFLATRTFLDPACGSGNFLTETYISLRKLENKVISRLQKEGEIGMPLVNIRHFYGIEIDDFAASVARTALWIAESQMLNETRKILAKTNITLDFLPLKSNNNIHPANALSIDWETVISKDKLHYIMGNPPFAGYSNRSEEQQAEVRSIYVDEKGEPYKRNGKIDYVSAWYFKASQLMQESENEIRSAFVSTNSITQGEQIFPVWKPLYDRFKIHIDFAYRTFCWDSEASDKAHVHCVIIGFSTAPNPAPKRIYPTDDKEDQIVAENINCYLINAPNIFIDSRSKPLCNIPKINKGSMPIDNGFLSNYSQEKMEEIVSKYPNAQKFFRPILGAEEFLNAKKRYCLWITDDLLHEVNRIPPIMDAIAGVKKMRSESRRSITQRLALYPYRFAEIRQPSTNYLLIPEISSEKRRYIPIGFMKPDVIASDASLIIPDATLYHFGVLTSSVHNGWMRTVAGRLEMRYRYSKDIVYNNFPWCEPTKEQKAKIEQTAQGILDARDKYPDCSLADLYDELTMPEALRNAHIANDKAVLAAYGLRANTPEPDIVQHLMKLYCKLTATS